jgi:6-pyruvoyltetrahydropterin/6-carboxytetrahydropterin synthase
MYTVTKEIYFCYGHRLLDYSGKCARLHGHNGRVQIELKADSLDKRGMVYDFGDVKEIIQHWIDKELDHKMILHKNDPLTESLRRLGESFFEAQENPTAEYLAKLIYQVAKAQNLPVTKITFWENLSSFASYSE